MKTYIYQIAVILLVLVFANANLHTRYVTRYCTENQMGGNNEDFANRLKAYVESCPTQSGYCEFENPGYPIQNQKNCGGGIRRNIGWMITYTFYEDYPANYEIDWGTDFGGGSAIFVNGEYDVAYQEDFWWERNWNSRGVFNLNYDFPAGENTVYVVANEFCCDGPMEVQFSRNGGPKKPLTKENFSCQQTNSCDGVECNANEYKVGFECKACNYNCQTCSGAADQCLTCKDPENRLESPSCTCKAGFYNVEGNPECQPCHSSCLTCSNNYSCDTCPPTSFKASEVALCTNCASYHENENCGTCTERECKTCKNNVNFTLPTCTGETCLENQYQVGQTCHDCHSTCKTCIDSRSCTSCEANWFKNGSYCQSCESEHGAHCGTCNKFECLTCKVDASYKLPECTTASCGVGQTADGNTCRNCISGCETCSNESTCDVCLEGYYKTASNTCLPCTPPCLTCQDSATNCITCTKQNFTPSSDCTECVDRFFLTSEGQCASCVDYYGEICGVCNETECTRCHDPNTNVLTSSELSTCTSPNCPLRTWKDNFICRDCIENCLVCSDSTTCDQCDDLYYRADDGTCQRCQGPCLLCSSETVCTLCTERGWKAPGCDTCGQGFFMHEGECIQSCPSKFYGRHSDNTCQPCDDTCFDCENDAYYCTICPNEKFLYNGKCVDCDDVIGMMQHPEEPKGVCIEECGDGLRLVPNSIHECDDGNNEDGDGCNANCEIEEGWLCSGGNIGYPDTCQDKRPIGFDVQFTIRDEYLNIEGNAPINAVLSFNKTFTLPVGTTLKDYIVISIEGKDTSGFTIDVEEIKSGRLLSTTEQTPSYNLTIQMDKTVRNRELVVDLYPKSAFQDGAGNILADEEPPKGEVKDYFYYNEEERDNTSLFEFWMGWSIAALMCFLPIYVFYYKNHFNRFYIIFMIIDCTQTLYFYRFLNIRWAINGIKFYRKLRPVIGFYMPNFYETDISEEEFEDYSSGVTKFDKERESALFMNNTGNILTLLFIYIAVYLIVVVLSQPKLYVNKQSHKVYNFFYQFRHGYLQWGVWFDSMMASCGVFIIYIFLQLTNPLADVLNTSIALGVAVFYFGFFITVARFTSKNLKDLYTIAKDEDIDGMSLEDKVQKNHTFKLRNVWHFVHNLDLLPQKAYFYFIFLIRKCYLAGIVLLFQNHPTIQLLMSSFSHLAVIILLVKYRFFNEKKETYKAIASETLIFLAIGCMYFLLDDVSEEESYRLTFSWIVLFLLLLSLFIHGVYFLYNEIFAPLVNLLTKKKIDTKKVIDLRTLRKEGKGNTEIQPLALEDTTSVYSANQAGQNIERGNSRENSVNVNTDSPLKTSSALTRAKRNNTKKFTGNKAKLENSSQSNSGIFDNQIEISSNSPINADKSTRKHRFVKTNTDKGSDSDLNSPQIEAAKGETLTKSKFFGNQNTNNNPEEQQEFF